MICMKIVRQLLEIGANSRAKLLQSKSFKVDRIFTRKITEMTDNNKKVKLSDRPLKIGTHDGIFHCDEILACFMLQQLPQYKNAQIIRSRKDEILGECDILVDVGSKFDPDNHLFDHHQKSFEHTISSLKPEFKELKWNVRLSSAGLVYVFFGEAVIKEVLAKQFHFDAGEECLRNVYRKVYKNFIEEIDGIDNGVPMYDGEPLYKVSTDLSARVSTFNKAWNSKGDYDAQAQFELAKQMVGEAFLDKVQYYATVWWPARSIVQQAFDNRFSVHKSGEILELSEICPWKDHFFEIESESEKVGATPKYVLFENSSNDFRVICVPNNAGSFVCRKFLHKDWRGIRNEELVNVSGIAEASFVHATGFIGGASTRDGTLRMAELSLAAADE